MTLDLLTLLHTCVAASIMGALVLTLFGVTQSTHAGFRAWLAAQWLLAGGLALAAFFADAPAGPQILFGMLLLQWPIAVLSGMRRLYARKRPVVPAWVDWAFLSLVGGAAVIVALGATQAWEPAAAYATAAAIISLYAAALLSRLGGFTHSLALKGLAGMLVGAAALQASCSGLALLREGTSMMAISLGVHLTLVLCGLGLVPIALALSYERTVAKMRATHHKLRHLADVDVLTRLPNRRHFHDLATRTLATTESASTAVLMLDIENLKRINDLLGPATGDEALRQVGLVLRETLRARDVAGRVGGDEFAVLLPDTTVTDAVRVSERISARLQDRQVAPRTAKLTLNAGAVQMQTGDTIVEALRRADIALDDARVHSRGRVMSGHDRLEASEGDDMSLGGTPASLAG